MNRILVPALLGATLLLLPADRALRADDLVMADGSPSITGVTVREATWEEIEYKMPSVSRNSKIPAERVDEIVWTSEPPSLVRGRAALAKGDFTRARSSFQNATTLNQPFFAATAQFMLGWTELTWAKQDPSHVGAAVTELQKFVSAAQGAKHYYVPQGALALAEAHSMAGDYAKAESALSSIAGGAMGSKWVEAAKLKRGQVQLAQDKFREARELFGEVQGSSNPRFSIEARVGYAACQVGQQQWEGVAKTLEPVLGSADRDRNSQPPRYGDIRAQGWIVLGQAEEGGAGGDEDKLIFALYHYLRASVVAVGGGETFAEALYRAKKLYENLGNADRASLIDQRMNQLCPNSPWTKR